MSLVDQPLPFDDEASNLLELKELRAEVSGLRAEVSGLQDIADAALYFHGHKDCLDNECDCEEYVDTDGQPRPGLKGCPNVETRYATMADAIVRERLEYLVSEVLDWLDAAPQDDETGATVRAAVRDEIQRCGMYALEVLDEFDPRCEQPRPAVFDRIRKADREETQAILAANRGGKPDGQ